MLRLRDYQGRSIGHCRHFPLHCWQISLLLEPKKRFIIDVSIPSILLAYMTPHFKYVIPLKQAQAKYVSDFSRLFECTMLRTKLEASKRKKNVFSLRNLTTWRRIMRSRTQIKVDTEMYLNRTDRVKRTSWLWLDQKKSSRFLHVLRE